MSTLSLGTHPLVAEAMDAYRQMSGERMNFETHWEEISKLVWPEMRNTFRPGLAFTQAGEKRTADQLDATPQFALQQFSAILDSLLTPRNQKWHRLRSTNPEINKIREVQLYFDDVRDRLFAARYASTANYATNNNMTYMNLGAFGTSCMFIDALMSGTNLQPVRGLRYKTFPVGQVYVRENHQGIIDTILLYYPLTAKAACNEFKEATPEKIVEACKTQPDQQFWFIHYVCPQYDHDPERYDYKGKPFRSVKVNVETQQLLGVGGFNSFPFAVSRYSQYPLEAYGRSVAMIALPAMKTLNAQKSSMLKQMHRALDPILLSHDDGIIDNTRLKPGMNRGGVSSDGRLLVQPLPFGNVEIGLEAMDAERSIIKQAFLVHLFELALGAQDVPDRMTVPQVLERMREKGILLAPTVGRQQSEYLGPKIEREIDVMTQLRMLPPMPDVLKEAAGEYQVVYDSPLSRSMRAEEAAGFVQTVDTAVNIANATGDTTVFDPFEFNVALPELAEINGVPARWMASQDRINQKQQARAQQQETENKTAAAGPAAALLKAAAAAKKEGMDVGGQ